MKISAVVITFNEERNIEDCLKSLERVSDEILVVDSFSTDHTEEICGRFKEVIFIKNKFRGHVEQKNYALEQASNDYILSLDADERLSEALQDEILRIKKLANPPKAAYCFPRLNNFCGQWIKHGGWYPDLKIRLWDRRKGRWGGTNPHDQVIMESRGDLAILTGDLLHYSFRSLEEHMDQINKFSSIAAAALMRKSTNKNVWFNIIFAYPFTFIKKFIVQAGFLDGFYGYIIAKNSAHAKFLKYVKYQNLKNKR